MMRGQHDEQPLSTQDNAGNLDQTSLIRVEFEHMIPLFNGSATNQLIHNNSYGS
jgi:hypothetical protein